MAPFCGEPAVVIIQPADHRADIERAIHGVELEGCTGDFGAVGDDGAWDDWAEQFRAFFEAETFETAAESVEEDEAGSVELWRASISTFLLIERRGSLQRGRSL